MADAVFDKAQRVIGRDFSFDGKPKYDIVNGQTVGNFAADDVVKIYLLQTGMTCPFITVRVKWTQTAEDTATQVLKGTIGILDDDGEEIDDDYKSQAVEIDVSAGNVVSGTARLDRGQFIELAYMGEKTSKTIGFVASEASTNTASIDWEVGVMTGRTSV